MGIYIKAKKISENKESLIYNYGLSPDDLKYVLKIYKGSYEVKRIFGSQEISPDITSMMISAKIYGYFKCNGKFPDEISKEA